MDKINFNKFIWLTEKIIIIIIIFVLGGFLVVGMREKKIDVKKKKFVLGSHDTIFVS